MTRKSIFASRRAVLGAACAALAGGLVAGPASACSFIREPKTPDQLVAEARAVLAVEVAERRRIPNTADRRGRVDYRFRVIQAIKGDVGETWEAESGLGSCGFGQAEGARLILFLGDRELEKGRVDDTMRYWGPYDAEALREALGRLGVQGEAAR